MLDPYQMNMVRNMGVEEWNCVYRWCAALT